VGGLVNAGNTIGAHETAVITPGAEIVTVPRGLRHLTRPVGDRSVNLIFEAAKAETVAV